MIEKRHRRRPGRDDRAGEQGAAVRAGERRPPRGADAVPRQRPVVRGRQSRHSRSGPRPRAARLPSAGPEFLDLFRRTEPAGGSPALPEQLRRQDAGRNPLLVRHARQPAPRDGGPQAAVRRRERRAGKIAEVLKKLVGHATFFDGVHIFTPHGDVPDDSALRLVVLSPEQWYSRDEQRQATNAVLDYVRNNGTKPRYRGNRLIFLAPTWRVLSRLRDAARVALAWGSIVEDVKEGRLNIDLLQKKQAEKELQSAEEVVPRAARECYKWLLCPVQDTPTDPKPTVEAFPLDTTGDSTGEEFERVCVENELVIATWSPIHLRTKLKELYWKDGKAAAGAMAFWEDTLRYLYLPRLKNRDVLSQAIHTGAASRDFFGTAYGQTGETFEGFHLGDGNIQFDDTLLLIEPEAARLYEEAHRPAPPGPTLPGPTPPGVTPPGPTPTGTTRREMKSRSFHLTADVTPSTAKLRLVQLSEEIISVLCSDPNANVRVTLEMSADFPEGVSDQIKRNFRKRSKLEAAKSNLGISVLW